MDYNSATPIPHFTVSEFLEITNQTFDYAFPFIELEGEIMNLKVSKAKWVFFNLKDAVSTIPCFMTIYQMRTPLRDGMKAIISGSPRITKVGRFSFNTSQARPIGEGDIKKAFDILKDKLTKEGLFDQTRKRPIPKNLSSLGVISSVTAAGYADFIKILNARWGGLDIWVANCGVQGASAADEIIRAIDYFNTRDNVDMLAIVRGGGSADDLAVFNDEPLVKKIASSRIPIITGIGHEIDTTLADLAADVRASTPSNAAEFLTRDKTTEISRLKDSFTSLNTYLFHYISNLSETNRASLINVEQKILSHLNHKSSELSAKISQLSSLNPETILQQGYSILSGNPSPENVVKITTFDKIITAEVKHVQNRQ